MSNEGTRPSTIGALLEQLEADRKRYRELAIKYEKLTERYHKLLGVNTAEMKLFRDEKERFFADHKDRIEFLEDWISAQKAHENAQKKQIENQTEIEAKKMALWTKILKSPEFRDVLIGVGFLLAFFRDALMEMFK